MDTKINIYLIFSKKQHNFLKILIVISVTSVLWTRRNYILNQRSAKRP